MPNDPAEPAAAFLSRHRKQRLIGGRWVDARSGCTFQAVNPANGAVPSALQEGGKADVDRAAAAARTAFESARAAWCRALTLAQLLQTAGPVHPELQYHPPRERGRIAMRRRPVDRRMRVAGKLRNGSVWVNCLDARDPAVPFGGYKMSGMGRDGGRDRLDGILQIKSVIIAC